MWRHLRAVFALPFVALVVVPAGILTVLGVEPDFTPSGIPRRLSALAGLVLVALGLSLLSRTIALFATEGEGTLAPWDPTRRLVVRGVYRHVRNPMISGVFCVLAGEALLFRSLPLAGWAVLFLAANAVYIPLVEERGLERRFGNDYREYRRHVPRWIPRLTPWRPRAEGGQRRKREPTEPVHALSGSTGRPAFGGSPGARFMRVLKAGALYFALVFAVGFMLGPIRQLWVVPRVGATAAELMEMPLMLAAIILAARWSLRRLAVPPALSTRLGIGLVALGLLLVAEFTIVLGVRGLSVAEYLAGKEPVAGAVYALMLAVFAAMPALVGRRGRRDRSAHPPCSAGAT